MPPLKLFKEKIDVCSKDQKSKTNLIVLHQLSASLAK